MDLPINNDQSILGQMRNEDARVESFHLSTNKFINAEQMAKAGFFYSGVLDRVQCPYCKGILGNWEADDVPYEEHRRNFPYCPFLLKLDDRPNPIYTYNSSLNPSDEILIEDHSYDIHRNLCFEECKKDSLNGLKLNQVKNSFFSSYDARYETYACWPLSLEISPSKMAESGFYYLGFEDYVKCFYCDGGLRNWKKHADPWEEHAKWFSKCPFLEIVKGERYAQDINNTIKDQDSIENLDKLQIKHDAEAEIGKKTSLQSAIEKDMGKPLVKAILALGVPYDTISSTLYSYYKNGVQFESSEALLQAISLKKNNTGGSPSTINFTSNISPYGNGQIVLENTPKSNKLQRLESENKVLKEQRFCKICLENEMEVVFINCGHFASCSKCALMLKTCPICREDIRGTVRTYLS